MVVKDNMRKLKQTQPSQLDNNGEYKGSMEYTKRLRERERARQQEINSKMALYSPVHTIFLVSTFIQVHKGLT